MTQEEGFASRLAAAQAGGEWALALLYRDLNPAVLRFLRTRLGDDGEDAASEAWIDIARNLGSFEGDEAAFRRWVFTIVHRRVVDAHRRRGRRPVTSTAEVDSPGLAVPSAEAAALEGALGDDAARALVAGLPPEQADIVLLRVVAGLSVEEVAGIVGRRAGTVRVLQHRALKRLARDLPEQQ